MPTKEAMQTLGEQILRSYDNRAQAVAELRSEAATQLAQFDRTRNAMGAALRADLGRSRTQLRSGAAAQLAQFDRTRNAMGAQLRADLKKGATELESAVATQLAQFDRTHNAMGAALRADLGRSRTQLRSEAAAQLAQFDRAHRSMAATRAGGQAAWRRLMSTLRAKRGRAVARALAPTPPVAKAPPMAPPPPVIEEMAEEEAMARAEVSEITPELATLRDRVFAHLADHPDGTRLVEMEQEFGRPRILMARVVRSLMDEGKVEKRDLLYFAI